VALAVGRAVVGEVLEPLSTALELGVLNVHASVQHVAAGSLAGLIIISVSGGARLVGADSGETPRSVLLGGLDCDNGVLLDVVDLDRWMLVM
jgi:hypothetical protein